MSSFKQIRESMSHTPERFVTLEPSAFCSEWPERHHQLILGLRKISDADIQTARAEAAKFAISMHDDREGQVESFNDYLMRWLVVRGTCSSEDMRENADVFAGSEENVRLALTSQSIKYVYDHIDQYHIECSPLVEEVTDEEIPEIFDLLVNLNAMHGLPVPSQKRLRKLLGFCLSELKDGLVALPEEPEEQDESLSGQPDTFEEEHKNVLQEMNGGS